MKYFRFYSGHTKVERENYIILGIYEESRLKARSLLKYLLYEKNKPADEPEDRGLIFEYIDERELHEGEEPLQIIYGYIPNENDGTYPDIHSWEQSY